MDSLHYLAILAACVAVTMPLEFALGARVYRRPRMLAVALPPVVLSFVAWDLFATAQGHWWFAERYIVGLRLLGLPIEEWLFFVVVALCAILTYEALGSPRIRAPARGRSGQQRSPEGERDA